MFVCLYIFIKGSLSLTHTHIYIYILKVLQGKRRDECQGSRRPCRTTGKRAPRACRQSRLGAMCVCVCMCVYRYYRLAGNATYIRTHCTCMCAQQVLCLHRASDRLSFLLSPPSWPRPRVLSLQGANGSLDLRHFCGCKTHCWRALEPGARTIAF